MTGWALTSSAEGKSSAITTLRASIDALLRSEVRARELILFRLLAGLLTFAYFATLFVEVADFSAANGLIDHGLSFELFWFTRLGLFHGPLPAGFFHAVYSLACLLSLAVALGRHARLLAAVLYAIAVSTYRWNFLVIYVDDVVIHLVLFWLILLPRVPPLRLVRQGGRLGLSESDASEAVRGFPVLCFALNVALVYWVAGLSKWTSPMWRDGTALYAVLKLPLAHFPEFWNSSHLPLLKLVSYCALVIETLLPFLLLQRRSQALFWAGVTLQLGFHAGIIASIGIPFANLALMATPLLFFGLQRRTAARHVARPGQVPRLAVFRDRFCLVCVLLLFGACLHGIPTAAPVARAAYAGLWTLGLAQNYHLFDWIDSRNYAVVRQVEALDRAGVTHDIAPELVMPTSPRHVLLQMNLHGLTWLPAASTEFWSLRPKLKAAIRDRYARRFCEGPHRMSAQICVHSWLRRVTSADLDGRAPGAHYTQCFSCPGDSH